MIRIPDKRIVFISQKYFLASNLPIWKEKEDQDDLHQEIRKIWTKINFDHKKLKADTVPDYNKNRGSGSIHECIRLHPEHGKRFSQFFGVFLHWDCLWNTSPLSVSWLLGLPLAFFQRPCNTFIAVLDEVILWEEAGVPMSKQKLPLREPYTLFCNFRGLSLNGTCEIILNILEKKEIIIQ